jgi:hypothetical protein
MFCSGYSGTVAVAIALSIDPLVTDRPGVAGLFNADVQCDGRTNVVKQLVIS